MDRKTLSHLFALAGVATIVVAFVFLLRGQSPPIVTQLDSPLPTPTPQPRLPTPTVKPTFEPTAMPSPTPLPPIAWEPLPPCRNLPDDIHTWRAMLMEAEQDPKAAAQVESYWRQVRLMSPTLANITPQELSSLLDVPDTARDANMIRRELAVLWLNVMSGRLNLATEVHFPTLLDIKTVQDLIKGFEQALKKNQPPGKLLGASKMLQAREGISRSVCFRLVWLQIGNTIKRSIWIDENLQQTPIVRHNQDIEFPWVMGNVVPSPNHRLLAVETGAYESGGPILLFDVETGEVKNLNQMIAPEALIQIPIVTPQSEEEGWYVIGWHPNSSQLLIGADGLGSVFWVNLDDNTFSHIPLEDTGGVADRQFIDLAPNGLGFAYVTGFLDGMNQRIDYVDLKTHESRILVSITKQGENLYYPRFAPSGDSLLYLIGIPYPSDEQVLAVLDFDSSEIEMLLTGDMDIQEPVWSPDEQSIVLFLKDPSNQAISLRSVGQIWQGNLWSVSPQTRMIQQVTFVNGAAFKPVWTPDSRRLAFLTHDGSIGLVSLNNTDTFWEIAEYPSEWPSFTSMYFEP
ncbi:MAG: hypothetical protein GXP38_14880 [Chloroflexi bacterium]|nr:hypothetical protein [Chloroflexota bacterium]